jgi:DNA polymerase
LEAPTYDEFHRRLAASNCSLCPDLCASRTNIVVDRGNPQAQLVLIGEAPGEKEDLQGWAFVGRSGQLLDRAMESVGLDTNRDALIVNVVKCRPPKNRPPKPQEAANCWSYLKWQLDFVKPRYVALFGATAAKYFLPKSEMKGMKERVGKFFTSADFPNVRFMLLYHPAYILRDPRKKKDMWEHVKELRRVLDADEHVLPGRKS